MIRQLFERASPVMHFIVLTKKPVLRNQRVWVRVNGRVCHRLAVMGAIAMTPLGAFVMEPG